MAKSETPRKNARRSHRAQFPTPGFYLFSFLLNLLSLVVVGTLLFTHMSSFTILGLGLLALVGVIICIYSSMLKPKESNKKTRKILVSATAAYGGVIGVITLISIIQNPSMFI